MPNAIPVSLAALKRAWHGGLTLPQMAAKFGMNQRTVSTKAAEFGLPKRTNWRRKPPHPMLVDILGMYRMGVAVTAIADIVKMGPNAVYHQVRQSGEKIRGRESSNRHDRPKPQDWFAVKPEVILAQKMAEDAARTNAALARMVKAERGLFNLPSKASAQAAP